MSVFDRQQVAAIDGVEHAPLEPPRRPLTGDSHAHLLAPLQSFTESLGFAVCCESIPGATGGWCDQKARRIVVDADQPANARLRILIHETGHALGVGYAEYGRVQAELIAESTTHLAAASVGLDLSGETVPYVAGWGENDTLEPVTAFAGVVDELARRIETVLVDAGRPTATAPRDVRRLPSRLIRHALEDPRPGRRLAWRLAGATPICPAEDRDLCRKQDHQLVHQAGRAGTRGSARPIARPARDRARGG